MFCYVKLSNQLLFQLDFQIMGQHTGVKWLIHGIKNHKDNQLQSLEINNMLWYIIYEVGVDIGLW